MFFTFLPGTQLKGELEPWSWCPSKSRWSAAPLSVRDEHWTFEHFVRERWTLLSLLAFNRLAMTLPSQADLEVARFPNPLASGSDIHGSWGTWLTWRLLWSRSQNHLGQAVKNPFPHFSINFWRWIFSAKFVKYLDLRWWPTVNFVLPIYLYRTKLLRNNWI